ncbi:ATP-dependent zinc metalloprotease FTSH 9, chloroplastic-like, partial [Rutidosis leptorrhynchoides]|uniref:ATP-dependent zinc metalloprotease FTSH 9, chloroplastic-like n=1 Tax=Rutidosis leptorrhynchoides TaxID=125765 RepID=UPI003A99076A
MLTFLRNVEDAVTIRWKVIDCFEMACLPEEQRTIQMNVKKFKAALSTVVSQIKNLLTTVQVVAQQDFDIKACFLQFKVHTLDSLHHLDASKQHLNFQGIPLFMVIAHHGFGIQFMPPQKKEIMAEFDRFEEKNFHLHLSLKSQLKMNTNGGNMAKRSLEITLRQEHTSNAALHQVQRSVEDPSYLVATYEGEHNHKKLERSVALKANCAGFKNTRDPSIYLSGATHPPREARFNLYGSFFLTNPNPKFRESRILANSQDSSDSKASSSENSETEPQQSSKNTGSSSTAPSSTNQRREKQEKRGGGGLWWSRGKKFQWQPLIQAQELGVLLLQLGIVMFVMRLLRPGIPMPGSEPRTPTAFVSVSYSEFLNKVNSNQVSKVEVDGVHIMFKLKNEATSSSVGESEIYNKLQESESLLRSVAPTTKRIVYTTTRPVDIKTPYEKMLENDVEFGSPDKRSGGFFNSALIALFYVAVLAGLLHRFPVSFSQGPAGQIRNLKSGATGGGKVSENGEAITFADVAGVDEAKEELEEIVEFLRNPDRYVRLGARPPRGVLLVGLPGTGKTLLAKAVAGEAEVPFISCSASEFVELYVGMGASRVRDLFARAKKEAPSIIFIDEIDAVAKSRDGRYRIVSNDEREQTLNQLLTEMDGFDSNSAVIVLGATNRADVLDPALRRPGRFDRVVMVETPDRNGREAILKVHASKKELPLGEDVNLGDIASMTTGFTGADLANLVNEAALLAGRKNKVVVEKFEFIEAVERSIAGIEKKTVKLQGSEKGVVARHEAGHAVVGTAVANLLPGQPRVE